MMFPLSSGVDSLTEMVTGVVVHDQDDGAFMGLYKACVGTEGKVIDLLVANTGDIGVTEWAGLRKETTISTSETTVSAAVHKGRNGTVLLSESDVVLHRGRRGTGNVVLIRTTVKEVTRKTMHIRAVFHVSFAVVLKDVDLLRRRDRERSGCRSAGSGAGGGRTRLVGLVDDGPNVGAGSGFRLLRDVGE